MPEIGPRLWAHLVSQHCAIISPETPVEQLVEMHEHEHDGPCTIRNHDRTDRSYSLQKMGRVLSEHDE